MSATIDVAGRVHRHAFRSVEPGADDGLDGGREQWGWSSTGTDAVVVEPFGLTVAFSVAPVTETELAEPVATVGGGRVMNEPADAATVPPALVATTRS